MSNNRTLGLIAAFGAASIYGVNHTIAKGIMPNFVPAFGLVQLRVIGAFVLFFIAGFFCTKEKIQPKDYWHIALCSLLGMCTNMLSYFKGLELSTPINSAVLVTTTPIIVALVSALIIKERMGLLKVVGILLGFIGALVLIIFGFEIRNDSPNISMGNLLFLLNATSYGLYLILVKKMLQKYHPFTIMKWLFLCGVLFCSPFGLSELINVNWEQIPLSILWKIVFVVVATTFLTYLFNIYALKQLNASVISAFVYLQPVFGIAFAVYSGEDDLNVVKILATALVLIGLYLVTAKKNNLG